MGGKGKQKVVDPPAVIRSGKHSFTVGSKFEAKDSLGNWYEARAVKVNSKKREILVHFDGWGARFDEWLPPNSPRIRVPPPHKTKKQKEWRVGDRIIAKWGPAGKIYPATISKLTSECSVEITFFDGFKKILSKNSLKPDTEKLYRQFDSLTVRKSILSPPKNDNKEEQNKTESTKGRSREKRKLPVAMSDYITDIHGKRHKNKESSTETNRKLKHDEMNSEKERKRSRSHETTTSLSATKFKSTKKIKQTVEKAQNNVKLRFGKETIAICKPSSSTTLPIAEKLSDHCSFDLSQTSKSYVIFPSSSSSSSLDNQITDKDSSLKSPVVDQFLSNEIKTKANIISNNNQTVTNDSLELKSNTEVSKISDENLFANKFEAVKLDTSMGVTNIGSEIKNKKESITCHSDEIIKKEKNATQTAETEKNQQIEPIQSSQTVSKDEPRRSGRKRSTKSFGDDTITFSLKKEKAQTPLKIEPTETTLNKNGEKSVIPSTRSSERKRLVNSKYRGEDIYTPKTKKVIDQEKLPVDHRHNSGSENNEPVTIKSKINKTETRRRSSSKSVFNEHQQVIPEIIHEKPFDLELKETHRNSSKSTESIQHEKLSKDPTSFKQIETKFSESVLNQHENQPEDIFSFKQSETDTKPSKSLSSQHEQTLVGTLSSEIDLIKASVPYTVFQTQKVLPTKLQKTDVILKDTAIKDSIPMIEAELPVDTTTKSQHQSIASTSDDPSTPKQFEESNNEPNKSQMTNEREEPIKTENEKSAPKKPKVEKPMSEKAPSKNFEQKYELFKQKWKAEKEKRRLMKEHSSEASVPIALQKPSGSHQTPTPAVSHQTPTPTVSHQTPTPFVSHQTTTIISQPNTKPAPISSAHISTNQELSHQSIIHKDLLLQGKKEKLSYASQQGNKTGPTLTQLVASKIHKKAQAHQKQRQEAEIERKTLTKKEEIDLTAITLRSMKSPPRTDDKPLSSKKKSLDFITGRLNYKKKMELLKVQTEVKQQSGTDYFNLFHQSPPLSAQINQNSKIATQFYKSLPEYHCSDTLTNPVSCDEAVSIKITVPSSSSLTSPAQITPVADYKEKGMKTPDITQKTSRAESTPVIKKTIDGPSHEKRRVFETRRTRRESEKQINLQKNDPTKVVEYHCTLPGCTKSFRKQHLLQYHLKYFHSSKPIPKRSRSSVSVSSTDSNPQYRQLLSPTTPTTPGYDTSFKDESGHSIVEVTESSEEETESESEFTTFDDCVKCVCQDECDTGFMIQCEQCFTWQHGECVGYNTQKNVPLFYLCHICSKPNGLRNSFKYKNDFTFQRFGRIPPVTDSLEESKITDPALKKRLASMRYVDEEDEAILGSIMIASNSMVTDLFNMRDLLQNIRNRFLNVRHRNETYDGDNTKQLDNEQLEKILLKMENENKKKINEKEVENASVLSDVKIEKEEGDCEIEHKVEKIHTNHSDKISKIETMDTDQSDRTSKIETMDTDQSHKASKIETIDTDQSHKTSKIETIDTDQSDRTFKIETMDTDQSHKASKIETMDTDQSHKTSKIETMDTDQSHKTSKIETMDTDQSDKTSKIETMDTDQSHKTSKIETMDTDQSDKTLTLNTIDTGQSENTKIKSIDTDQSDKTLVETIETINQSVLRSNNEKKCVDQSVFDESTNEQSDADTETAEEEMLCDVDKDVYFTDQKDATSFCKFGELPKLSIEGLSPNEIISRFELLLEVERIEIEVDKKVEELNGYLDVLEKQYDIIDRSKNALRDFKEKFKLPDTRSLTDFLHRIKWTSIIKESSFLSE